MKIGQNFLLLISVATLVNVITCDVTDKDCHVIITACRQNATCLTAMENVESICKVKDGRCDAQFANIPTCARYLDLLRSKQFFGDDMETPCRCNQKTSSCSKVNKFIKNPCIFSIAYLRKKDQMPSLETTTESTNAPTTTTRQQQHKMKTRKSASSSLRVTEKTTKIPSKKVVATRSGVVLLSGDNLRSNITKFEYVANKLFNHTDKKKAENPEQYLALIWSLIVFILLVSVAVVYYFVRRTTARKKKDDGNTKEPLVA